MRRVLLLAGLALSQSVSAGILYRGDCFDSSYGAAFQLAADMEIEPSSVVVSPSTVTGSHLQVRRFRSCVPMGPFTGPDGDYYPYVVCNESFPAYTVNNTTGATTVIPGQTAQTTRYIAVSTQACQSTQAFSPDQLDAELRLFGAVLAALAAIWGVRRLYQVFNDSPREA